MADFSDAQNIGTNTGSAPTAATGVSDAGAGKMAAVADTASGLISIFGQNQRQNAVSASAQYKAEAESQGNRLSTAYMLDSMRVSEAVESGAISRSEGTSRMRAKFAEYAQQNPEYISDLVSAHKDFVTTTGLGKVIAEGTEAEQRAVAFNKKASDAGFNGPEQVEQFRQIQQHTEVLNYETTKLNKTKAEVQLQGARSTAEQAAITLAEKKSLNKAKTALWEIGTITVDKGNADYRSVMESDAPVAEKLQAMGQIKLNLTNQIRAGGGGVMDGEVNGLIKMVDDNYKLHVQLADGKIELEAMQTQLSFNQAKVESIAFQDANLQAVWVAAKFGRDSAWLMDTLGDAGDSMSRLRDTLTKMQMGDGEAHLGNLEVTGRPGDKTGEDAIRGAVTVLSEEIQADATSTDPQLSAERVQAVRNLLIGINEQTWNPSRPKGQSLVMGFIADPKNAKYLVGKHNEFSDLTEATSKALDVTGNQLAHVIQKEMNFKYGTEMQFSGVGVSFEPGADNSKTGVNFTGGENMHAVINMNNKMKPLINQYIRAKAHLEGHTDYRKTWEETVKPQFFPAMANRERLAEIDENIF